MEAGAPSRATPRPGLLVRELPPVHAFGHRRAGWQSLIVSRRPQGQAREHARPSLRRRLHRSPHSPCRERKGGRRCRPLACRGALVLLVPLLRALRAARALSLRTSRLLRGGVRRGRPERGARGRATTGEFLAELLVLVHDAFELRANFPDYRPERIELCGGFAERSRRIGMVGRGHERQRCRAITIRSPDAERQSRHGERVPAQAALADTLESACSALTVSGLTAGSSIARSSSRSRSLASTRASNPASSREVAR